MKITPELHQQLLEYVYEVLPDDDAAALAARLAAEPEMARALEDVKRGSQLLAAAARIEAPQIPLAKHLAAADTAGNGSAAVLPFAAAAKPSAAAPWGGSGFSRFAPWVAALAASIILFLAVGGYVQHRTAVGRLASEHLRLFATGPAKLQLDGANRYELNTTNVLGAPVSAPVEFAVYSGDGTEVLRKQTATSKNGRATLEVPAGLPLANGVRMVVLAQHDGLIEKLETRFDVEQPRFATQLSLDKPLYQPGDTVYYRSLTLSRHGLAVDDDLSVNFQILDPSGAPVAGSELLGTADNGVGNGAFEIPVGQAGGEYVLVAASPQALFPDEKRPFAVREYRLPRLAKQLEFVRDSYAPGGKVQADFSVAKVEGGVAANAKLNVEAVVDGQSVFQWQTQANAGGTARVEFDLPQEMDKGDGQLAVTVDDGGTIETIAKTIPINLGKFDVKFYPEGGDLVPSVTNRVYFTARDPLHEPVHLQGVVVDKAGQEVAKLETLHEGLGSFSLLPKAGEAYALQIQSPAGAKSRPELPAANEQAQVTIDAGPGVFAAGASLDFSLVSRKSKLPLVVAASCRGVQAAQLDVTTKAGANKVSLPLPDEIGGVIVLTVFDYSGDKPKPVAERLVYRQPKQRLNVRLANESTHYAPGETADVSLLVTDEAGQPARAALGVSVVDDALLSLADDKTASMPAHFLLATEIEAPEDLEKVDFYLQDDAKSKQSLDLLLGTQGWRRFAERTREELQQQGDDNERLVRLASLGGEAQPPAVFDNQAKIAADYESSLAAYGRERMQALGTGCVLLGAGLLMLLGMLAILRLASRTPVWLPTLAAGMACLIVGGLWLRGGSEEAGKRIGAVAYHPYDLSPPPPVASAQSTSETMLGVEMALEGEALVDRKMVPADAPQPMEKAAALAPMAAPAAAPLPRKLGEQMGDDKAKEQFYFWNRAGDKNRKLGEPLGRRALLARRPMAKQAADFAGKKPVAGELRDEMAKDRGRMRAGGARAMGLAGGAMGGFGGGRGELQQAVQDGFAFRDAAPEKFTVREYAHEHWEGQPGVRDDFADTLYWNPLLISDVDGAANLKFQLSDAVTTFRLRADAHDGAGRIGTGGGEIVSRIPFNLQPKLPAEVTLGDKLDVPLAVVNDANRPADVHLSFAGSPNWAFTGQAERDVKLTARERSREYYSLEAIGPAGKSTLNFGGRSAVGGVALEDAVSRDLRIVPPGFPVHQSYAGELSATAQEVNVRLPEDWVPGTLDVSLEAFPSPLADIDHGLEGILREPYGCFEQASTANYPNVLTLQYMQEHKLANPEITRRAKELLANGYGKLTSYESPQMGYEWFGANPGHEALTAYGLMEFSDMAQVHEVDSAMVERTSQWLLGRRDGKGGFLRNPQALDSFGAAPPDVTNAYITWALTEADQSGLQAEVKHVRELGEKSDDPYVVALAAASVVNEGSPAAGKPLLDKLAKAQDANGSLQGKQGSITRSGGQSLTVETTSLAALAWLKSPEHRPQADKAIAWLVKNRDGAGGFGTTQATILALKTLVENAKTNRTPVQAGTLSVKAGEKTLAEQQIAAGEENAIAVAGLSAKLTAGENHLQLSLTGDNRLPYVLNVSYRSKLPASDAACAVRLTAALAKTAVKAGETVRLSAELSNNTDQGQPMTLAVLGLPAGLEPRTKQLDDLKKAKTIDYYELRPREVILYWRAMAPQRKVPLNLDLVAEIPGQFTGPASRAYLYYTPERKQWVEPLKVDIAK